MANIKSQKKRNRTNEKARMRNRAIKSELKTATRHVKDAVEDGDGADAYASALAACRLLDKAASKGIIHKNQAANRKSGIMKLANTVVTDEDRANYVKPERKAPAQTGNKKKQARAERKAAKAGEDAAKATSRTAQEKSTAAAVEAAVADETETIENEAASVENTMEAAETAEAEAQADVDAAAEVEKLASEIEDE